MSAALDNPQHRPVLLGEVLNALAPRDGAVYVDGTFGAGGYTLALLAAAACRVWAIDRDPEAIAAGRSWLDRFAGRLALIEGRFGDMADLLAARGVAAIDGIVLDLGVSSMQLDRAERGFSFRNPGPLDMRMERQGTSAADLVNRLPEAELADLLLTYGEEKRARRIAKAIIAARTEAPIETTQRLADIVRRALGGKAAAQRIDPATRTFQALRIAVNDELGEIDRGLCAAEKILAPGGRLVAVAFHSLEDGRVKRFLKTRCGRLPRGSRHLPPSPAEAAMPAPSFRLIAGDAIAPGAAEIAANPRARSARLRAAERTAAPAWEMAA